MNTWKKLLSMLLILAMLLVGPMMTGLSRAVAEGDTTEEPAPSKGRVLETEDLDPADFHINLVGEREFTPDEPEEIDPEKIVRVSIFLEGKSTIDEGYSTKDIAHNTRAMNYRRALELQQATMQTKIEGVIGHDLDVKWNLTLLVNAISVDIPYKDIEVIKQMPGVKSVELENFYYSQEVAAEPNTSHTSEHMVGATNAWAAGYTGAGSKVAILDTGIDKDHISFNEDAFLHAIDEVEEGGKEIELMEQIDDETLAQLNSKKKRASLTAAETYISAKIPYAFNYADYSLEVAHQDQASNHGSHVAGISAANRYIKVGNEYKDAAQEVYAVGMAPDAQLIVMDVFQSSGGTYDSMYFAGIEDAIILGCDAANMSLGAPNPGFTYSNSYQDVLNRLASDSDINMVVAISAGNEGAQTDNLPTDLDLYIEDVSLHTGGTPGTFLNSICVASADNIGNTGLFLKVGNHGFPFWETDGYGNPTITTIAGEYEFVYVDGIGAAEEYAEVNAVVPLEGKIVICNRGGLSFFEKGNNAIDFAPKAVLVANNQPGQINMNLTGFTGDFPMVSFALSDALKIKEISTSGETDNYTYYTGSIVIPEEGAISSGVSGTREDTAMSSFSSWGVPGSLIMKPEITAPGGNIWSVNGTSAATSDAGSGIDKYVAYSGTSMAAPHIAGLTAVVAQYLRENPIENEELTGKYGTRAIVQSLLMSTATPMMDGENYYSLLQQGAGLVEVSKAINAPSVIMMDDAYLTTATKSDADGKVKVELGDDPEKTGEYTYKFTVYNTADTDLEYQFDTKMFTQDYYTEDGFDFMDQATVEVDADDTYLYEGADGSHDVNKDGVTDKTDAQAILDYLTGSVKGETLNLDAADMDGDKNVTSYDAELLLHYEPAKGMIVPAHGSKQVTVTIKLNETFEAYPNGAYVEGFTYVTCISSDEEGVDYAHEHTIPILGFYGDYTDPSMFDCITDNEMYFGMSDKIPYCTELVYDDDGNLVDINWNTSGYTSWIMDGIEKGVLSSNPFTEEDLFYEDHLATRSDATVGKVYYNLIRNAGTGGYALSKVDGYGGDVLEVLDAKVKNLNEEGLFYYASQAEWWYNTPKDVSISKNLSGLGLKEGDTLRVAYYALPEYVAMKQMEDLTDAYSGRITDNGEFAELIESNKLGRGMYVGYDFIVDDTKPEIGEVALNDETGVLSVEVSDNVNVAYVALMDMSGNIVYAETIPAAPEATVSLDATDAISEALTYVAVVVGDYAGNTVVKAAKVNNIDYVWETYFVLTDELISGETYAILNTDQPGSAKSINASKLMNIYSIGIGSTTVNAGIEKTENLPYLGTSGFSHWGVTDNKFKAYDRYLRANVATNGTVSPKLETTDSNNVWTWNAENHTLSMNLTVNDVEKTYYLGFNGTTGIRISDSELKTYLFVKKNFKVPVDVDPYKVTSLTVNPDQMMLFEGQSAHATVSVLPLTADPSVTWESSDPTVATVDEDGVVKGLSVGESVITATSVADPTKTAEVYVVVTTTEANDLKGIVWDPEADTYLSAFNTDEPENWTKLHEDALPASYLNGAAKVFNEEGDIDLYLTTFEDSQTASKVYKVDETTYVLTEIEAGSNGIPPFDIAEGIEPNRVTFCYGKYAGWINMLPEENEDGSQDSLSYGTLFKFDGYWQNVYCIAAEPWVIDEGDPYGMGAYYYAIDEAGDVYFTELLTGGYATYPGKLLSTGIIPSNYDSLYVVPSEESMMTFLYWTHYNEDLNSSEVMVIAVEYVESSPEEGFYIPEKGYYVPVAKGILRDGKNFGDGVWPVVGLYSDMILNEETVGTNKFSSFKETSKLVKIGEEGQIVKDKDLTLNVMPKKAAPEKTDQAVTEPDPISAVADRTASAVKLGSINRAKSATALVGAETRKVDGSSSTSYPNVTVTLSEDKASTNGFFTVKYDPSALKYVSNDRIKEYSSISVDQTKGEIKFAYASMNEIAAKKTLATIEFTATGKDTTVTVTTTERGNELALNETSTIQVKGEPKPATVEVKSADVQFNGKTPYRVYNGKAQTPGYVVKDEKGNVIPASKYKAEYKENVKAGTAYIFITFPNKEYKDCRTWFKIYLPATTSTKVENVENGIKISWTKVEGAAGYVVYRRAWNLKDKGWTTFERWNNTTGTSWVDTKVYAGTRYQYGVKAFFAKRLDPIANAQIGGNVGDNYNLGIVGPLKTTVRITTRVLNSVTAGSKKLTIKWAGSSIFTGYQVQVATDAKFTQNLKTVTISNAKTYETTISGLKAKTTYYVRVRSYHLFEGMTYYGQWSNVLNGKTK